MTGQNFTPGKDIKKFISGVVEGFYGRPWSADQRKLMFTWMQKSGMNTYMYAPKDDYKHRAYWRELYSVEEAESLTHLITSAKEKGTVFVYAISPGLDISFSNTKDVQALKRKLEQVSTFGCDAFAILFDDIDPELSEADRSAFQSYGLAQATVSNEVYEHLHQPTLFLFCPTEYCASRASPNVMASDYLNTIGSKLLPGIDIMWTGPRVVSKRLTIASLEEISSVLKRPAVIWDNIYANDYDPRRIFLGSFDGRSPEIIPYINGVLANPNTEFEVNYVAIHTLGQWCKSNLDGVKKDIISSDRLSPIAADIKLETECDFSSDEDSPLRVDLRYQPKLALKTAIGDWLTELHTAREPPLQPFPRVIPKFLPPGIPVSPPGVPPYPPVVLTPSPHPVTSPNVPSSLPGNPPIPPGIAPFPQADPPTPIDIPLTAPPCMDPSDLETDKLPEDQPFTPASPPAGLPLPDIIKTCLTQTATNTTITSCGIKPIPDLGPSIHAPDPIPTFFQPPSLPVSSLAEPPVEDSISDETSGDVEPMEVAVTSLESNEGVVNSTLESPIASSSTMADPVERVHHLEKQNSSDSLMQVEGGEYPSVKKSENILDVNKFTEEDILLLTDLFHMPFEHGSQGILLLQKLHWLRANAKSISKKENTANSFEAAEWKKQAEEYNLIVERVMSLLDKLVTGPNKAFMCDMYSYVWDLVSILKICQAFVKWLGLGIATHPLAQQTYGCVTWFSMGYKEAFLSGEQEPWVFRGGLQAELQRLLPIDSAHDLFYIKPPDYIVNKSFTLRPYNLTDESAVYDICLKTCDDGMDGTDVFPEKPQLIGDKLIGKLTTLSPEHGFVIEDDLGVCGYVLAARDTRELSGKSKVSWLPVMLEKYPYKEKREDCCSPADEIIQSFHGDQPEVTEELYTLYPSVLRLDILPSRVEDPAIPRRLLACCLSALKCCGSKGAHCELNVGDKFMIDFYAKLGFFPIKAMEESIDDVIYLGRPI